MTIALRPLSRREVRQLDARATTELALPSLVLMENAGRGAAAWFAELDGVLPPDAGARPFSVLHPPPNTELPTRRSLPRVLVLCGPGKNGGDGGVVARHLDAWGFPVRVVWCARSEQIRGDAAAQRTILEKSGVGQSAWFDAPSTDIETDAAAIAANLADAEWLVDGIFGTGLSRPVEGPLRTLIEAMNGSGKPIFALDLPSGLDADTGEPLGVAIRARATATFVAAKRGFTVSGADAFTGEVAVIDIGLPRCLLEPYVVHGPDSEAHARS
jgi:NAD(P)H-hydrate epimerase